MSGPFQSVAFKVKQSQEANMSHVVLALKQGERDLAAALFARVSKRILANMIDLHRQNAMTSYPEVTMVVDPNEKLPDARFRHMKHKVLTSSIEEPALHGQLEASIRMEADDVALHFTGRPVAYLLGALETSIELVEDADQKVYSFRWKQRYAV